MIISANLSCPDGMASNGCAQVAKCSYNMSHWESQMAQLYAYFNLLIFVPGLLGNSLAVWVLSSFIRKKTKAIIFMINLAIADLAHVLSLPLRIYYYFSQTWAFGHFLCMLCFYLKYLNMYASIYFLACISIQRCSFLMQPFRARSWKRRYDVCISVAIWLVVGFGCSPFILMRSSAEAKQSNHNCFKDLPMRKASLSLVLPMVTLGEVLGFGVPLVSITLCSCLIMRSLRKSLRNQQVVHDKHKALRMVLVCTGVFLFCFTPYHINFLLYMMESQELIRPCPVRQAIKQFHPISLCIASLNCCLNPIIYYFLTTEFRQKLSQQGSSVLRKRLMSWESTTSGKE